jgi:hypothetical protein
MKSFTNLKTIDEIMYIVDGNNSGYGLGYKPYKMTGGMGKANPLFNPNKKIDKDNLPTNYGDNIYYNEEGEYIDKGDTDFYKRIDNLLDDIQTINIDDEKKEKSIDKYIDTLITEYNDINQLNTKYINDTNNKNIKEFNDNRINHLEDLLSEIIEESGNNNKIKDMMKDNDIEDINTLISEYGVNGILEYISTKKDNKPQNNLIEKIENNINSEIQYMPKNIQDSPYFEK